MNASGKTSSLAPLAAASAASPASLSIVASRSRMAGSAWTQATVTRPRMRAIVARWLPDAEAGVHPARSRDQRRARKRAGTWDHACVDAEPLLEQRRIHRAEIHG